MTIDEIIADFRVKFDFNDADVQGDSTYQIIDDSVINWISEAQLETCRRARILSDSSLSVSIVSGRATYYVPDATIQIRRARLSLEDSPLKFSSSRDMDEDISGWESHTGTPTDIITDIDSDKFTLYPEPLVSDKLRLTIIREPDAVTSSSSCLEIPARFHYSLVDWLLYRAYQVRDADSEGRAKSLEHLSLFEQEFGTRSSAKDETFNNRQMPYSNSDGFY